MQPYPDFKSLCTWLQKIVGNKQFNTSNNKNSQQHQNLFDFSQTANM